MWGQGLILRHAHDVRGIIPTRVGTRTRVIKRQWKKRDHPHACGDKQYPHIQLREIVGSSPRVWGQVPHCRSGSLPRRIIPTRVGTSTTFSVPILTRADHPHACGDKQCLCIVKNQRQGSSPRVWGQVILNFGKIHYHGIIPTRVGTRYRFLPPHECN